MDIIKAKRIVTSFFNNTLDLQPDVLDSTNEYFDLCAGAKFDDFYCSTIITIAYDVNGLLQVTVLLGKIEKPTFDIYTLMNEYNRPNDSDITGVCFRTFIQDNHLMMNALIPFVAPNRINQHLDLLFSILSSSLTENPVMEKLCDYIIKK